MLAVMKRMFQYPQLYMLYEYFTLYFASFTTIIKCHTVFYLYETLTIQFPDVVHYFNVGYEEVNNTILLTV